MVGATRDLDNLVIRGHTYDFAKLGRPELSDSRKFESKLALIAETARVKFVFFS